MCYVRKFSDMHTLYKNGKSKVRIKFFLRILIPDQTTDTLYFKKRRHRFMTCWKQSIDIPANHRLRFSKYGHILVGFLEHIPYLMGRQFDAWLREWAPTDSTHRIKAVRYGFPAAPSYSRFPDGEIQIPSPAVIRTSRNKRLNAPPES